MLARYAPEPPSRRQDSNHASLNDCVAPKALEQTPICGGRCARKEEAADPPPPPPQWRNYDFVARRNGGRRVCGGTKKQERVPRFCVPFFMFHILGATKVPRGGANKPRRLRNASIHARLHLRLTEETPASCSENSPRRVSIKVLLVGMKGGLSGPRKRFLKTPLSV